MSTDNTPPAHRPLTDLIGLDPNFTGGLSTDEYLRRQRCGECDEALRERDEARAALATVTAERERLLANNELLQCSTMGEAYDRLEQLVAAEQQLAAVTAERDEARIDLGEAKSRIKSQHMQLRESGERYEKQRDALTKARQERDAAREQAKQAQAELAEAKAEQARIAQRMAAALEPHLNLTVIRRALADATSAAAPKADEPKPTVCPAEYTRPGGRQRGDRIVRCHLPYGHGGEHEEAETECTWLDEPLPAAAPDPDERCCPNHREPGEARYGCASAPGVTDRCCDRCHYWIAWNRYLDGHDDEDAQPVPAGGEDGSGTADGNREEPA